MVTVAMVAAGLCSLAGYLRAKGVRADPVFWILVMAVTLAPLLPGQHKPYAFHRADWNVVLADIQGYLNEGDIICFPCDSKAYAMVIHYSDEEFFKRHPVTLWRPKDGAAPFLSLEGGIQLWFLRQGAMPASLTEGLGGRLELIATWHLYPQSVRLYRLRAADGGGPAPPAVESQGER